MSINIDHCGKLIANAIVEKKINDNIQELLSQIILIRKKRKEHPHYFYAEDYTIIEKCRSLVSNISYFYYVS